jgi:hypothetical protein
VHSRPSSITAKHKNEEKNREMFYRVFSFWLLIRSRAISWSGEALFFFILCVSENDVAVQRSGWSSRGG